MSNTIPPQRPDVFLFHPFDKEQGSGGSEWNNSVTRRSFLKRTGGATAATIATWHLSSSTARAAQQNVHPCTTTSNDPNWAGRKEHKVKPSNFATGFGHSVGTGIANEMITSFQTINQGPVKAWMNANASTWQDTVRSQCISAMTTFYQSQTQDLTWDFEGYAVERKKCSHLNGPSLKKMGDPSTTSISLNLTIGGFGISVGGSVTYDLNIDGPAYFQNYNSEKIQVPVGPEKVCSKAEFSSSVTGTLGGVLNGSVSGSAKTQTQAGIAVDINRGTPAP